MAIMFLILCILNADVADCKRKKKTSKKNKNKSTKLSDQEFTTNDLSSPPSPGVSSSKQGKKLKKKKAVIPKNFFVEDVTTVGMKTMAIKNK